MNEVSDLEIERLLAVYCQLNSHHRAMVQDLGRELQRWEDEHPERYSEPPFEAGP